MNVLDLYIPAAGILFSVGYLALSKRARLIIGDVLFNSSRSSKIKEIIKEDGGKYAQVWNGGKLRKEIRLS